MINNIYKLIYYGLESIDIFPFKVEKYMKNFLSIIESIDPELLKIIDWDYRITDKNVTLNLKHQNPIIRGKSPIELDLSETPDVVADMFFEEWGFAHILPQMDLIANFIKEHKLEKYLSIDFDKSFGQDDKLRIDINLYEATKKPEHDKELFVEVYGHSDLTEKMNDYINQKMSIQEALFYLWGHDGHDFYDSKPESVQKVYMMNDNFDIDQFSPLNFTMTECRIYTQQCDCGRYAVFVANPEADYRESFYGKKLSYDNKHIHREFNAHIKEHDPELWAQNFNDISELHIYDIIEKIAACYVKEWSDKDEKEAIQNQLSENIVIDETELKNDIYDLWYLTDQSEDDIKILSGPFHNPEGAFASWNLNFIKFNLSVKQGAKIPDDVLLPYIENYKENKK
jgi:hypothetical protein